MRMDSREIDVKIQALLFPWDGSKCRTCGWTLAEFPACTPTDCSLRPRPSRLADEPAGFSTSLDAAMGAYEEFRKKSGLILTLSDFDAAEHGKYIWTADLWDESEDITTSENAETPALAICLAILAAAGLSDVPVEQVASADKKEALGR